MKPLRQSQAWTRRIRQNALAATVEAVQEALVSGDRVQLVGFGTWSVQNRPARMGRNPSSGESIQIAAKNVVRFKPGASLSNAVN